LTIRGDGDDNSAHSRTTPAPHKQRILLDTVCRSGPSG
jgi:hypothetical protein